MKGKLKIKENRYNGAWGYEDTPWEKYDAVEVIPSHDMLSGKAVDFPELKRMLRVGKVYKIKPTYTDKKLKAKLLAIYSDPVSFGNKGKYTPVRLKTEWEFVEGGDYFKGKHEIVEDLNLEYATRSKKRQRIHDKLWRKHGMNKEKSLEELKRLIKERRY
jgi:hypothetical protein